MVPPCGQANPARPSSSSEYSLLLSCLLFPNADVIGRLLLDLGVILVVLSIDPTPFLTLPKLQFSSSPDPHPADKITHCLALLVPC